MIYTPFSEVMVTPSLNLKLNRHLSPLMANAMEGLLTDEELLECLFKKMKGSSSPGIDGLTVNHLRVFWHDLKDITREALNQHDEARQ